MIHQDADGVIFQALDKQTGHFVALRRFFLPDEVIARLKEKEENGKSIFENGMEWLKVLDVPHLQKVVAGGFDELDETPYFVTEWVEARKLKEAHEEGIFSAGEGDVFDGQARSVLQALPMEVRPSVCLEEDRILVSRDDAGSLSTTLLISPRIFFGTKGGMEFTSVDRQAVLEELKARFPAGQVVKATPIAGQVTAPLGGQVTQGVGQVSSSANTQPVLKSAQTSGGKGLLWGSMAALFVLLGLVGWLVFKGGDEKVTSVAEKVEVKKLSDEEAAAERDSTEEVVGEDEPESTEPADVAVAEVEEVVEEPETSSSVQSGEVVVAADEIEEASAMVSSASEPTPGETTDGENEEAVAGSEKEQQEKLLGAEDYYTWEDIELLKTMGGQEVKFRGKVARAAKSGGRGTLWYLDFGDIRKTPFVVLPRKNEPKMSYEKDWRALQGKEVFMKAKVGLQSGRGKRGSGVILQIRKFSDVKFEPEKPKERVFQFADLDDLRVVSEGEKVIFEGDFKRYQKNKGYVYLFFQDGIEIVGRFVVGGPLSNRGFADKMEALKGKRVRLIGSGASDENERFQVVIDLNAQNALLEAPAAEGAE